MAADSWVNRIYNMLTNAYSTNEEAFKTLSADSYSIDGFGRQRVSINVSNALNIGSAIDGTPDEIYLCCRPLSTNANIEGSITWREIY